MSNLEDDAEWPSFKSPYYRDDGSRVYESDDDYEDWFLEALEELEYDFLSEVFEADLELISLLKSHQWEKVHHKDLESQATDEQQQISQRLHPAEVRRLLGPLTEYEKKVLKYLYGVDIGEPRTVCETAEFFNISPELVAQIEKSALDKLRCATDLPLPITETQQLLKVVSISPNVSQVIGLLERLGDLLSNSRITQEEFEKLKASVMHEYK